jgi:hypothetical protein
MCDEQGAMGDEQGAMGGEQGAMGAVVVVVSPLVGTSNNGAVDNHHRYGHPTHCVRKRDCHGKRRHVRPYPNPHPNN